MRFGIGGFVVIACATLLSFGGEAVVAEQAHSRVRNVAIVVWNGAEILDWAGPTEVFAAAGNIAAQGGSTAFHVYTVSKTKDPIVSQGFVRVLPDYSIKDAPKPDIVVFPGGGGSSVLSDPEFFGWAKAAAANAEVALSVCTGAFILGRAGFLDGKQATTWHGMLDQFEKEFPKVDVRRGSRFVDNGTIVTTAGVSAGIDGSLHVVARLLGRYVADETAQYMEYRWTPEAYLSNSYTLLNPSLDSRGRRVQQAEIFVSEGNPSEAIRICEQLVAEKPDDAPAWRQLGQALHSSKRYEDAVAAFTKAARSNEVRAGAWYDAACSAGLLQNKERALDFLKKSFDAGLEGRERVRYDPDLALLHKDPRLEALIAAGAPAESARQ